MKRIILLLILTIGLLSAIEYRLVHLKKGARLNVREAPVVNSATRVGTIPANAVGIRIKECKYSRDGKEWCYISYPMGAKHLDGWVSRYFLAPMGKDNKSYIYIKNFLKNYYMADEDNFMDKLKVFYHFPMQQYFNKKNLNLIQLRTNKVAFYKKWLKRKYKMTALKILKRTDRYIDVRATVKWRFESRDSNQSGKDIQKVRLVHNDDAFKVLAIKNLGHFINHQDIREEEIPIEQNETIEEKHFYVKVGSFFSEPNSEYLLNITQHGFNYTIQEVSQDEDIIKRVYIGPYNTEMEAIEVLKDVRLGINKNAYIQSF